MKGSIVKVCEVCGGTFECGQYCCWCGQLAVTTEQMDWIEQAFDDCLCPSCLRKIVSGEIGPTAAIMKRT
ncbi:cysteine-rich CWC family protein [Nitrospira sp. KM1]|uniref:cysteine-rich CWC family protein n=1 Tax=Nitrospira sp. KM1 TaxID=1936990 RepID=UPI003519F714